MTNDEYARLSNLPKKLTKNHLQCAAEGSEESFNGYATFDSTQKFRVIQNRCGHKSKILTYVLIHNPSKIMLRVDLQGKPHNGLPTPHVHIYDDDHDNGSLAIPLAAIPSYNETNDIINSLIEFLKYNKFDLNSLQVSEQLVWLIVINNGKEIPHEY